MKNNREPVNGPRAAHNLGNPSEPHSSGPGWIRTNHPQNDDSGRLAPRSDPQGSESTETAGTLSPETVGLRQVTHFVGDNCEPDGHVSEWRPKGSSEPLPFDDPPCECACHDGTGDTQFCACWDDPPREPAPQISLEDRLYIALSARGALSMCEVIVLATGAVQPFHVKDEDLVSLVEDWVFGAKGSRDGAPE